MKVVGKRREPAVVSQPSGALLEQGARFNEALSALARSTFIAKGVYRFRSHEAANRHAQDCLVAGMARRAAGRE